MNLKNLLSMSRSQKRQVFLLQVSVMIRNQFQMPDRTHLSAHMLFSRQWNTSAMKALNSMDPILSDAFFDGLDHQHALE